MCPKHILSCDIVDDQFLDRSCIIFPGSRGHRFPGSYASKLHDVQVAEGSHDESHVVSCDMFPQSRDESHVVSCDMFPQSRDAEVTGL